jgi:hypothetical protein
MSEYSDYLRYAVLIILFLCVCSCTASLATIARSLAARRGGYEDEFEERVREIIDEYR